ncbi:hypothetical protein HKX48_004300, partial [Thoreauomyces humboldtii]
MTAMRVISTFGAFLVVVSYAVLPGKRTFPRIYILFVFVLTMIWSGFGASLLYGQQGRAVFCAGDGVTSATLRNNRACAVQGVSIIWASIGTGCFCMLTILNIHLQVVWSCSWLLRNRWLAQTIGWLFPTFIAGLAIGTGSIEYLSRGICTVTQQYEGGLVFAPLIVLAVLVWALHTATTLWLWRRTWGMRGSPTSPRFWGLGFGRTNTPIPSLVVPSLVMPDLAVDDEACNPSAIATEKATPRRLSLGTAAATTPDGTELAGVRFVQLRLIVFGTVLGGFAVMYAIFYQQDVGRIRAAIRVTDAVDGASVATSPLQDLVACIHAAQASLTMGGPAIVRTCANQLEASGRMPLPRFWRRLVSELTISLGGVCLFAVIARRLFYDWRDWFDERRGVVEWTRRRRTRRGRASTIITTSAAVSPGGSAASLTVPSPAILRSPSPLPPSPSQLHPSSLAYLPRASPTASHFSSLSSTTGTVLYSPSPPAVHYGLPPVDLELQDVARLTGAFVSKSVSEREAFAPNLTL